MNDDDRYKIYAAVNRFWRHCRRNAGAPLPTDPAPGIAATPFKRRPGTVGCNRTSPGVAGFLSKEARVQ